MARGRSETKEERDGAGGTPDPEEIRIWCADRGFSLSPPSCLGLARYLALLSRWSRVMNLVGPEEPEVILRTLIADSLHLAGFLRELPLRDDPQTWDLGAGAGLPGIPLRQIWQKGTYTLVESREKRAAFLRTFLVACPLPGVTVFRGRAEDFIAGHPPADLVISRAFLPWRQVLDLVAGRVSPGGCCLFLASGPAPAPPDGWSLLAQCPYPAGEGVRHFWAFSPLARP
ncbi:MAG: 16S rRNA (guanine(527)-N(7))-methyltransferase RsmG [Desulfovibrio sp.]|jgi:16S rRNA (guanine527-N7)-methyltransferase|nr:16S rRNA (guanine(527)-N(7))-methyltransferase RsmG [Desulfovibrio sp.]